MSKVLDLWAGMTATVLDFAGTTAPGGWLLCFGQAVSRATYPTLFAQIGTTYGAGDGSTTFNLPDYRGRVAAGKDNMGGTPANRLTAAGGVVGTTLGAVGGGQTHALSEAQMPSHWHGPSTSNANFIGNAVGGGIGGSLASDMSGGLAATSSTGAKGGSEAHPNVQPTLVLNKIIKT